MPPILPIVHLMRQEQLMKNLRSLITAVAILGAALIAIPILGTGCSTTATAPGQDKVLVEAERDIQASLYTVDAFLQFVWTNQKLVGKDVLKAADRIRKQYKLYHAAALSAIEAYSQALSIQDNAAASLDKQVLDARVRQLQGLATESQSLTPVTK